MLNSHLDAAQNNLNAAMELSKEIQQDIAKVSEISTLLGGLSSKAEKSAGQPTRTRRTKAEVEAERAAKLLPLLHKN